MYVCGVTVYDDAHIGHAMSAVIFDIIRRYCEWRGFDVQHVVNFTDVDDKIIERAHAKGLEPIVLAEGYINDFLQQLETLNVLPATAYPRATETMDEIIAFIVQLIEKGHAYVADGDVYFRVASFPTYGKLSGRTLQDMLSGTRVDLAENKESSVDFALWKAAKPGEPYWESPWGHGRPGWHIECSAMNLKHLGEQIDIHGGGNDLIFPHHENEIAQSEGLTGKCFSRYWIHNGMLQYVNPKTGQVEKMSKSLGNLVPIRTFLAQHDADVFRLIVLSSHYRSPLTYNEDIVAENERKLERLRGALLPATGDITSGEPVATLTNTTSSVRERFVAAMDNDFSTTTALAALFDLVRAINTARDAGVGGEPFTAAQTTLRELAAIVGLRLRPASKTTHAADPFVDLLLDVRQELRQAKQFALSDKIRDTLQALGVTIEDTPQGARWHW
jgi:cysteinyl-tRNA synthetase